jgi:hypothetical protein
LADASTLPLIAYDIRRGLIADELRAPMTGVSAALRDRLGVIDSRLEAPPTIVW